MAHSKADQLLRERHFTEILALIAGGMSATKACDSKPEYPSQTAMSVWVAKKPERLARWRQVVNGMPLLKYSEAHYDEVLDIIRRNPHLPELHVFQQLIGKHLPSLHSVRSRIRTHQGFAARYKAAVARRPVYRGHSPAKVATLTELEIRLREQAAYAAANAALPRGIEPWDRDDIISDIVEAVLTRQLEIDRIAREKDRFVRGFFNRQRRQQFDTLDRQVGTDTNTMVYADTFTTDDMLWGC